MNAVNESWLSAADSGVLRLITAGSVDDGKSTLIGRLLYDSKGVFADQLAAISRSKYKRAAASEIDLSLLTDGLEAEREQGITIDVAYRYFATPLRKFIVADAPGHEQYTRNMVTGASTAEVAVILIDASRVRDGKLLPQTKRHSALAHLLGLRHIVVAVNKMDLVGWDPQVFERIRAAYAELAAKLGIAHFHIVPMSALEGGNVVRRSEHTPWYDGLPLLALLENLPLGGPLPRAEARFFVQWVIRHDGHAVDDFRGYAGRLAAGTLAVGDAIKVLPAGATARVARLVQFDRDVDAVHAGDSVAVVLDRDIDVSRGDLIVAQDAPLRVAREFEAELCWLDQRALSPVRQYWLKQGTRLTQARIKAVHTRRDIQELQDVGAGGALAMNDIGRVTVTTREALALDPYDEQAATGAFILIDAATHQTAAAGMVR
ncbi:sulfate adenylyltransferase subunit 1 [Candidimonas nitroreducens]|uniref:sulfate adenylyltransferase n=1 Tax=Candidimonas nitroreducens TaxID=683354 RepID=A0A225MAF9_9BURK|nr:GTP-binding protein [Candidimonas nitroreducens]OWT58156.1 sulfate adenylyltransferase [Candidimonas nitroreducens]